MTDGNAQQNRTCPAARPPGGRGADRSDGAPALAAARAGRTATADDARAPGPGAAAQPHAHGADRTGPADRQGRPAAVRRPGRPEVLAGAAAEPHGPRPAALTFARLPAL